MSIKYEIQIKALESEAVEGVDGDVDFEVLEVGTLSEYNLTEKELNKKVSEFISFVNDGGDL